MTNKEMLQADLLDIIFENRNKDYGAYALRRNYNSRLLMAIGAAMSAILLFILINALGKKNAGPVDSDTTKPEILEIRQVTLQKVLPVEPQKPKELVKPRPVEKIATQKFTSQPRIVPDKLAKNILPEVSDLDKRQIGDITQEGKKENFMAKEPEKPVMGNTGDGEVKALTSEPDFKPMEKAPEFPGGPEALKRFLARNLNTPAALEAGEKKMVQIRFKVEQDGKVSGFEILASGGSEFDNEVARVCKKMPRWNPAVQNGIYVPVSYVLPVTFIGAEQ